MAKSAAEGLMFANRDAILLAAVHASAQLVLHLCGEQRLDREDRQRYYKVLRELLAIARAKEDDHVPST